jgi:DNA excision repair protein ERCC-5
MEWEASPPPAPKQLSRNVSKALSDVQQQDNFDRALLRASRDPDEDDFDDSLSIRDDDDDSDDGLSEHERAEHRKGIFPAPPRDLAEDEGGVDMNAEGDDYARFLSQIKGRNLTEVRQEIDNEIRTLNQQNKVAMRDSEEITHQMVAQIQLMLRLFGIPYITAPMEAEAQCAELARLNLVDGVITDDNDVFLFGGTQCFKNLFNDAKYVECFIANDLDRELMLNRDRLISLAYLLGSDYTIGLPGVGPVVAMELMAEFPGPRGLEDFKQWWLEVQLGKDDTSIQTKFQKTFVSGHRSAKR